MPNAQRRRSLSAATSNVESRARQVTTNFRDVFAAILRDHLRLDVPRDFFPDYRAKPTRGLFT